MTLVKTSNKTYIIATQNNSQNYEKTTGAIKEITLYLNRRVGWLYGIKNKAGYMATPVACVWVKFDGRKDGQTDRLTNRWMVWQSGGSRGWKEILMLD